MDKSLAQSTISKSKPVSSSSESEEDCDKLKLKQQRISLKCLMTENCSLTIN